MKTQRIVLCLTAFLAITLSACGGSTGGSNDVGDGGVDPNDPDVMNPDNPAQPMTRIGSFDNLGTFNAGVIAANDNMLTAGESAGLSVSLVDENGNPVTDSVNVFFSSPCVGNGLSEIVDGMGAPATATQTSTGNVNVTYTARGCDGTDTVTANASVDNMTLTAMVTLQTQQAPVGSIQFTGVDEPIIGIQGSGSLPEQAVVTFRLTNNTGGPVPNRQVSFSLNTQVGGIALSNQQGTTNSNGQVSTTVNSGTVATTVRVTATALRDDGSTTTAQSSGLAITTGIPDQDSFSVSADILNIEGWDFDGETAQITIRAADRFNNPVPDGTAVNFTTEGGSINGSCITANGACAVTLTSQAIRPADGRVTVRVSAIGEESFTDSNPSNGLYDDPGAFGGPDAEAFTDRSEAFRDDNENGIRDPNEPFLDFNSNSMFDLASGNFTGLSCPNANTPAGNCDTANTLNVFDNITIVFSGSSFNVGINPSPINLNAGGQFVTVSIADANGQQPPAGTTIAASTSQGTIEGVATFTQLSTNAPGPAEYGFFISPGNQPDDGLFQVLITTPNNVVTQATASVDQTP